jgi:hypothetical protein
LGFSFNLILCSSALVVHDRLLLSPAVVQTPQLCYVCPFMDELCFVVCLPVQRGLPCRSYSAFVSCVRVSFAQADKKRSM